MKKIRNYYSLGSLSLAIIILYIFVATEATIFVEMSKSWDVAVGVPKLISTSFKLAIWLFIPIILSLWLCFKGYRLKNKSWRWSLGMNVLVVIAAAIMLMPTLMLQTMLPTGISVGGEHGIVASGLPQVKKKPPEPPVMPLSNTYIFKIAFAEWEGKSFGDEVFVVLMDKRIRIAYAGGGRLSARTGDILVEGELYWHESQTWIIAENEADKTAQEVGGCTDGPFMIDFEREIFWMC